MAIEIKHAFTSLKGDGGDATLVRPSNWNAAHSTSMATGRLLGRTTAGVGAFEEIPISSLVAAALDETTGEAFLAALGAGGFETGDVKFTINPSSPAGWVRYANEMTIGKAGSGASYAAADAQALYLMIYDNIPNTFCAVSGGRSGNSLTDFNAGKTIQLPRISGRSIIGVTTGAGLSARALGQYGGNEDEPILVANLPAAAPSFTGTTGLVSVVSSQTGFITGVTGLTTAAVSGGGLQGSNNAAGLSTFVNSQGNFTPSGTISNLGSGVAHNNMHPFVAMYAKIKL